MVMGNENRKREKSMLPRRKAALMSKMEVRVVKSMEGRVRNLASACRELGV